ncbi:hypothetical protein GQ53DRAFT_131092 [Thozetella sp. PMI_491]|nr:hypothetical protein GQ53DRAFT_131092 [Thozetella sp. PMI_491]
MSPKKEKVYIWECCACASNEIPITQESCTGCTHPRCTYCVIEGIRPRPNRLHVPRTDTSQLSPSTQLCNTSQVTSERVQPSHRAASDFYHIVTSSCSSTESLLSQACPHSVQLLRPTIG